MYRPTTASSLSSVRAALITNKNQGGPLTTLGAKSWVDGQRVDQTLVWVHGPTDVVVADRGKLRGGPSYGPHAISTDVEVKLLADTGPLGIRYVSNGKAGILERGTVLQDSLSAGGAASVLDTGIAGGACTGVLLFDLAQGDTCWVVTEGVVEAIVDSTVGAMAAGDLLYTNATGELTNVVAGAPQAQLITPIGGISTVSVQVRLFGTI